MLCSCISVEKVGCHGNDMVVMCYGWLGVHYSEVPLCTPVQATGYFDWTEFSLTTSHWGIQGVHGAICTGLGRFKHIKLHRTFSNYIISEISRYTEFFYTSSG